MRRSRPTHDHIHDPDRIGEVGAVRYLEDNEYRRNTLPKESDWFEIHEAAGTDPYYTHSCPGCGLRARSNGWTGFTGITPDNQDYQRSWNCPECNADWRSAMGRPTPVQDMMKQAAAGLAQLAFDAIQRDGGITISLAGEQPSEGFAFSPDLGNEVRVPPGKLTPEIVQHYLDTRHDQLSQPQQYLGAWTRDDGVVVLDVSRVELDHDTAYAQARDAQQEAMWDIGGNREIPITENADINRPTSEDWTDAPASVGS